MGAEAVSIQLDRPRKLRYDHNALADLDMALIRDFGKSLFAIFNSVDEETGVPFELAGFAGTRLLLWAGLKWEDPRLTVTGAGSLIGEFKGGLEGLMVLIWQTLVDCGVLGDISAKTENPPKAATALEKTPTG